MSFVPHFRHLFAYEGWANTRMLAAIHEAPADSAAHSAALAAFSHMLAAQTVWLDRIAGRTSDNSIWEPRLIDVCEAVFAENTALWSAFMENLTEEHIHASVPYGNLKGEPFTSSLKDILTHVFNHSTYHRGQVILHLKGTVSPLPPTDFIVFTR